MNEMSEAQDLTISQQLARWAGQLTWDDVPFDVLQQTKLRVLDITGAMLGGLDTELVAQLARATFVDDNGVGTPVLGYAQTTGAPAAALLQATMGCVLEFDDSHVATGLHASTPMVAAAMARGRQSGASGRSMILAVLIGNEITCRLGLAAPGMFHKVGFHPTAVLSTFGAGYAMAKMDGLDERQTANAAGICASFASGVMASWEDGTSAKSLHAGWCAASAMQAVRMAQSGVTGPATALEGRFGFFRSHVQSADYPFNYGAMRDELGEHWEVMTIAPRAYPCGHYIQPFLDAALTIVRRSRPDPAAIERVECRVADYMVPLICEPALEKISPTTSWHGRYSLAFCVAECLLNGRFDKYSLAPERLADPRYTALTRRTGYSVDPTATDRTQWSGEVLVTMRDGTILRHRIEHMHGTPQNPITQDELIAKFLHNAQGVLDDAAAHAAIDRILDLDRASDIREVFAPLSGLRR